MTFAAQLNQTLAYFLDCSNRTRIGVATLLSVILHFFLVGLLLFIAISPPDSSIAYLTLVPKSTERSDQISEILEIEAPELEQEIQSEEPIIEVTEVNLEFEISKPGGSASSHLPYTDWNSRVREMSQLSSSSELGGGDGKRGMHSGDDGMGLQSFGSLIKDLQEGLDLVIVFDSTSSMGAEIEAMKLRFFELGYLLMRSLPETRVGLVTYKDVGDVPPVAFSPLTNDLQQLYSFLAMVQPQGGGDDIPEAVGLGIWQAVESFTFREDAVKVILVVGDAPPHAVHLPETLNLARRFASLPKAFISTITIRSHMPLPEFQLIAAHGNGEAISFWNSEATLHELLLLIFQSGNRQKAIEFLKIVEHRYNQ